MRERQYDLDMEEVGADQTGSRIVDVRVAGSIAPP
jgi:hypothetical protein